MYNVSTLTRVVRKISLATLPIALASFLTYPMVTTQPVSAASPKVPSNDRKVFKALGTTGIEFSYETHITWVGEIALPMMNRGLIGSQNGGDRVQCLTAYPRLSPSVEFPRGSRVDHLYYGGLWIGGVRNGDTLLAMSFDGWASDYHLLPQPVPDGGIEHRTNLDELRPPRTRECSSLNFSYDAVSHHDLITTYTDTFSVPDLTGQSEFKPLGISVEQAVYSWSTDVASHMNIIDWQITNVSPDTLKDLYVGLHLDFDIGHTSRGAIHEDDIIGTLDQYPSWLGDGFEDSLNVFWATDHDGDPGTGGYGPYNSRSGRSVMGVQVLHSPLNQPQASFNWWVSSTNAARDWGPNKVNSPVVFLGGNLGTPSGDIAKYQMMANGEFDYDQMEAAIDYSGQGWLPPHPVTSADIADGGDTRCLLSFGPFTLPPDSSLNLTVAMIGGKRLHNDPQAILDTWDPLFPAAYMDQLNFSDLATQAVLSRWFYDNPGRDTDGDGYAGEFRMYEGDTVYYTGDGVPDFEGPFGTPPPYDWRHESYNDRMILQWNGYNSEHARDNFSLRRNFEGYRVYMSNTWTEEDFRVMAQRDAVNFIERRWNALDTTWFARGIPLSVDSLKELYDSLCLVNHGFAFHPDSFALPETGSAFLLTSVDSSNPSLEDTALTYFPAFDRNDEPDDRGLFSLDSAGLEVLNVIRKSFPDAQPGDTMRREDGTLFDPYYEYEFAIKGLHPTAPVYFSITAFDHGAPELGIESRESSVLANARMLIPSGLSQAPDLGLAKPGVFPNPYYFSEDYVGQGWESASPGWEVAPGILASNRKITFYNLPDICTITIWTLDGDLVAIIRHPGFDSSNSGTSMVSWDVRNSKYRDIRTGLYIYSIESEIETHIGKLIILK